MKKILLILLVFSFIITPINGLINGYNAEENIYQLGNILKSSYNLDGNIATNAEWEITTYPVYYVGGKYYGQTKENVTFNELKKELSDNNINYYLVWGNSKENVYLSRCFKEITNNKIEGLKIYKIN